MYCVDAVAVNLNHCSLVPDEGILPEYHRFSLLIVVKVEGGHSARGAVDDVLNVIS
jgi:hypothetical protein